jgi:hypothetical protein
LKCEVLKPNLDFLSPNLMARVDLLREGLDAMGSVRLSDALV